MRSSLIILAACLCLGSHAIDSRVQRTGQVYAFGDLHGDLDALVALGITADLIDQEGHWKGGTSQLVLLGDLVHGWADGRFVMDFVMRLQKEAAAVGGRVEAINGNHEFLQTLGLPFWMTPEELAEYADFPIDYSLEPDWLKIENEFDGKYAHLKRFPIDSELFHRWFSAMRSQHSPYAIWNRTRKTVFQIDRDVFVHGAVTTPMLQYTVDELNEKISGVIRTLQDGKKPPRALRWLTDLGRGDSPFSSVALSEELMSEGEWESIRQGWDFDRVFLGHVTTSSGDLESFYNQSVILGDTGLSRTKKKRKELLTGAMVDTNRGVHSIGTLRENDHPVSLLIKKQIRAQRCSQYLEMAGLASIH